MRAINHAEIPLRELLARQRRRRRRRDIKVQRTRRNDNDITRAGRASRARRESRYKIVFLFTPPVLRQHFSRGCA